MSNPTAPAEGRTPDLAPAKTFRERVEALKLPHADTCDMVLVEMSRHCDCGANLYNEALDDVLALCEDGGTPDAWRNDPKVREMRRRVLQDVAAGGPLGASDERPWPSLEELCAAVAASSGGARDAGADTRRIEWLARQCQERDADGSCIGIGDVILAGHFTCHDVYVGSEDAARGKGATLREAIDAAMSPSPEPTK